MPVTRRMSDVFDPMIETSIERCALGEDIFWQGFPVQTPDGDIGYAVAFWLRGPIIGKKMPGALIISNPGDLMATSDDDAQERFDQSIRVFLTNMIGQRSKSLNGHGEAHHGLLQPPTQPGA